MFGFIRFVCKSNDVAAILEQEIRQHLAVAGVSGVIVPDAAPEDLTERNGCVITLHAQLASGEEGLRAFQEFRRLNSGALVSISGCSKKYYFVWPLPSLFAHYVRRLTHYYRKFENPAADFTVSQQLHDFIWTFSYYSDEALTKMLDTYFNPNYYAEHFPGIKNLPPASFPPDCLITSYDDEGKERYSYERN